MFYQCSDLISLDISNFSNNKDTNMTHMFYQCFKLKYLKKSNFNIPYEADNKYIKLIEQYNTCICI